MNGVTLPDPEHVRTMQSIFAAVCNPTDWKAPIQATIGAGLRDRVADAIRFMTATESTFTPNPDGTLTVRSIGYRLGPAGDH